MNTLLLKLLSKPFRQYQFQKFSFHSVNRGVLSIIKPNRIYVQLTLCLNTTLTEKKPFILYSQKTNAFSHQLCQLFIKSVVVTITLENEVVNQKDVYHLDSYLDIRGQEILIRTIKSTKPARTSKIIRMSSNTCFILEKK